MKRKITSHFISFKILSCEYKKTSMCNFNRYTLLLVTIFGENLIANVNYICTKSLKIHLVVCFQVIILQVCVENLDLTQNFYVSHLVRLIVDIYVNVAVLSFIKDEYELSVIIKI